MQLGGRIADPNSFTNLIRTVGSAPSPTGASASASQTSSHTRAWLHSGYKGFDEGGFLGKRAFIMCVVGQLASGAFVVCNSFPRAVD